MISRIRHLLGRFLCWLHFYKWGEREQSQPFRRGAETSLVVMSFVRCQREECVKLKSVELKA